MIIVRQDNELCASELQLQEEDSQNVAVCFDCLYKFVWNISHSEKKSARYYHNCTQVLRKVPVIFVRFQCNSNFLNRFSKKKFLEYQISWKSIQWEPKCSTKTNTATNNTKLIFSTDFLKKNYSNIKFHENPFSGSRNVPWRRTQQRTTRS
jgi:hypothetical protein